MTSPTLLLPVRIPELGPALGKVITGTGRDPGALVLDAVRYRLASRLIDAAGEARRLAANDERRAAVAALGRDTWLEAWDEAVAGVSEALVERVTARLESAARAVRMPRRLRRRLPPDDVTRRQIAARLGSAGAGLIPALDALDARAERALAATALERQQMEAWREALRTAARRMDAAWLELEQAVAQEMTRWEAVVASVVDWRKPLWPVLVVAIVALALAVWLGLVFGGYADDPAWLRALWQRLAGG